MDYWDSWQRRALDAGVSPQLAALGRELMSNHAQHGRDPNLDLGGRADCELMLDLALSAPLRAEHRFAVDVLCASSDMTADEVEEAVLSQMAARLGGMPALEDLMEAEDAAASACWKRHVSRG